MESDQMRPLARRLLKCAIRRHVYETTSDDHAQGLLTVAQGLYADLQPEWANAIKAGGALSDPVYKGSVITMLQEALPEARAEVEASFTKIGFEGTREVEAFMASFQPEAYLP